MGSSGSGKSTMMNILACLDSQYEGTYILDGIDISKFSSEILFNNEFTYFLHLSLPSQLAK